MSRGPVEALMPFRATFDCLWCGTPYACRGPDDLEGWAQLCPDCVGKAGDNGFLRFRLHQALTERGAAAATPACLRAAAATAATRSTATADPIAPAEPRGPRSRRRDARLLRGPRARVRRLVSAPRPLRARPDPRRGLERRARRRRALARRPADRAARSSSWPPAPAGGRRSSPEGRAVAVRRAPRRRSTGPASGWSPTACAPTSTSATRGRSPDRAVDALFAGSG